MARSRSRARSTTDAPALPPIPRRRDAIPPERDGQPLLRLQTLGASRLQLGEFQLGLPAGMLFALVLRLVYTPGMAVPRDTLLRELWPSHGDARRRGNLRQSLYKLRSMGLEVTLIGTVVHLHRAQVASAFTVERTAALFERDVIRGAEPFGPFVPGFTAPSAEMTEWLEATRESVHADVRRILVEQLRQRRERADWGGAEVLSRWLLPFDPLNEDATLTLAECTMLSGAKLEAVAILDRYLAELGPHAGDIRLPATQLRKRFTEPTARRRPSLASTERHFVGRQQELAALTLAMRRARWHDGSAVLLHGPPGIGKTRVVTELGKVAQIEGYREVSLECRESDQLRPLGPFLDVLPELMASPGALGCSPESMAVLRKLLGEVETRADEEDSEGTCDERGAREELAQAPRPILPVHLHKSRALSVRHALVDIIGAVSEERPLYITAEDLHWMDADSWECLADLIQRAASMRIYVLATSRSRFGLSHRPVRFPSALKVKVLENLDRTDTARLAKAIGDDYSATLTPELDEWLVRASEGSPLMLRSLVNHWIETGQAGGIPPTLQVLLEQRLDRLHAHALRAMQVIFLLGKFADIERIRSTLQLPVHELLSALEQLEHGGCLARTDSYMVATHELIGRAATDKLPELVRMTLHSAIGDVLHAECLVHPVADVLLSSMRHWAAAGRMSDVLRTAAIHIGILISAGKPRAILSMLAGAEDIPQSNEIRASLGRLRLRLEVESGEYHRALALSPGGFALPGSTDEIEEAQVDSLLSAIDSAYRADPIADRDELATFSSRVANTERYQPDIRLRGAEIGLIISANTCDRKIASSCHKATSTLGEISSPEKLNHLSLLYHTIFGDLDTAEWVAEKLIASATARGVSTSACQTIARAGFTLRLTGATDKAQSALALAYEMALTLEAPRLAEYPAWQLAQMAIDAGSLECLGRWSTALEKLTAQESGPIATGFAQAHFCREAIFRNNHTQALLFLSRTQESQPRFPTPKASAYVVALELGARLLDPIWVPSEGLTEAAIEKHRRTASYGTSDFLTSCIIEGLIRSGRDTDARVLARNYLEHMRRERSAPSFTLARSLERLEVASDGTV